MLKANPLQRSHISVAPANPRKTRFSGTVSAGAAWFIATALLV